MMMIAHGVPVPAIGAVGFQLPVAEGLVTVGDIGGVELTMREREVAILVFPAASVAISESV
jgi:hypothetical protein